MKLLTILLLVAQALAFTKFPPEPPATTPGGTGVVVPSDGQRRLGGITTTSHLLRRGLSTGPEVSSKNGGGDHHSSKGGSSKHVSSKGGSSKGSKAKGSSKASKSKKGSKGKGKGKGGSKGSKSKKGSKGSSKGSKSKKGSKGSSKGSKSKKGSKGKGKGGSKGSKSKKGSKGSSKGGSHHSSKGSSKGGSVPVSSKGGSHPPPSKGGSPPSKGGSPPSSSKGGSPPSASKGGSPPSSKGGKGSPPTGKGKGSGPLSCTTIPILFYQKDITAAEYTNSAGFGLKEVPFYNPTTLEQLGTYSDFAVDIPESDECVADGAFSFGLNPDTGSYDSQITIAFTCGSAQNSITGGSGAYGCATGYEVFAYQDDAAGLLGTELVLCGPLCPNVLIESTAP